MAPGEAMSEAARRLRTASRVVALTGAGISRESGLPTFREARTGLWARYSPEELATPEAFARQPDVVWRWYAWRRELVAKARPNAGHYALAALESKLANFTLVTQNVDGLHQRAGSRRVLELHGRIDRIRCSREGHVVQRYGDGEPPLCPSCAAPLRPDVVWFGEPLPAEALEAAAEAAGVCEALLVIGTSLRVYPAAGLVPLAYAAGAHVVVIDTATPARPPSTRELHLVGPAAEILPAIASLI